MMLRAFLIGSALTSITSAQGNTVYRLTWVGDYQTGAWDTDAAENVAFDSARARAFIASAESGTVKVVSVADPTDMSGARATPTGADSHASAHAPLRRAHTHTRTSNPGLNPDAPTRSVSRRDWHAERRRQPQHVLPGDDLHLPWRPRTHALHHH